MKDLPPKKLRRKLLPAGLCYTRTFEVFLDEFWGRAEYGGGWEFTYDVKHNALYASFLLRMLNEMSNLQSFRFVFSLSLSITEH